MHQRHWSTFYSAGPEESKSTASPESFRVVCRAVDERDEETVEPAMRAAAEDVCGEYMEVVPADTRNLMGFYVSLRKLLIEVRSTLYPCGIIL